VLSTASGKEQDATALVVSVLRCEMQCGEIRLKQYTLTIARFSETHKPTQRSATNTIDLVDAHQATA